MNADGKTMNRGRELSQILKNQSGGKKHERANLVRSSQTDEEGPDDVIPIAPRRERDLLLFALKRGQPLAVAVILCGLVGIVPYLAVTQGQNEVEETLPQSPLIGVTSSTQNPLQIALLHWYNANLTTTFGAGSTPSGVAFDGANIWVANQVDDTVTKLRASDGTMLGTFAVASDPYAAAFDGANIWVANVSSNTVIKLRASDGEVRGTFAVGSAPEGVAFDGANIWVANADDNTVTKLRASDGAALGAFNVGTHPVGVAFDGSNVWVANEFSKNVTKLRVSDGKVLGTFTVGMNPISVAFDGANIWVANLGGSDVTKLRATDGELLGLHRRNGPY